MHYIDLRIKLIMDKRLLFVIIFNLCLPQFLWSQISNQSLINIKGKVVDTTNTSLPVATIMLLSTVDNKLLYFTHSDTTGMFSFKNIKNNTYLLKVTYLSYYPFQKTLQPSTNLTNDIGIIRIKPIAQILTEVIIKAARAPITFHGDTIEYNTTFFKVPPGSSVEDLLRRLPGIDIDLDGNIKTMGKNINTVYVDGNKFFGDSPKIATRNLGAEAISKVQVFNEKSEQEKLTGIKDGKKEKVMNLALKEEYKNSAFGKLTGGAGSKDRWLTSGSYFRFNDKMQLSFIGYGNNVNQTGISWRDYNEFKGKSANDNKDNGDFGFSTGGFGSTNPVYPFNISDSRGFSKNYGGGTNYNYFDKKTKIYSSYLYNQTEQNLNQYNNRSTIIKDNIFYNNADTSFTINLRKNHFINTRYQHEIDSNNNIIAKANINFTTYDKNNNLSQLYSSSDNQPLYRLNKTQFSNSNSWNISSTIIYSHRFKKEGQSFLFSAGYNNSKTDNNENIQNINKFFNATTYTEQINRLNSTGNITSQVKSSLLYTQPLFEHWYLESFYNFNNRLSSSDKKVNDALRNNARIDSLSSFYQSNNLYNRLGSTIHFSKNSMDIMFGLAGQSLILSGKQLNGNDLNLSDPIRKDYFNLIPYFTTFIELGQNSHIGFDYSTGITPPSISDLNSVPSSDNSLFVFYGNPNLKPEKANTFGCDYGISFPSSFISLSFVTSYSTYNNQIVYNQSIESVENSGYKTITKAVNVSGGNNINADISFSMPIIKSKLKMNWYFSGMRGKSSSNINDVLNQTINSGVNGKIRITISPTTKLNIDLENKLSYNYINYSIRNDQNQYFTNHSFIINCTWQMTNKIFFESSMNYNRYRNEHYNLYRESPIWNTSIRQIAGKSNRIEIRLSAVDILDKTYNISQNGAFNYFERQYAPTLSRYFILSLTYNIKGLVINNKK